MKRTVVLIVLDGWGLGRDDESNAIYMAQPERIKALGEDFPVTSLQASGISVGLPWGEVGNSEVGHLTLGAGKVLYQHFPRIVMAIQDGSFFENKVLKSAFAHAKTGGARVHLVGLLTSVPTHAALEHLLALIKMGEQENVPVALHLFSDGKDGPPKHLESLLAKIPQEKISTLVGRYYAMDRNRRWNLTRETYECLTGKSGTIVKDPIEAIRNTYKEDLTEEFLPPLRIEGKPIIEDNDAVIFFNFREDSIKQLAEVFLSKSFDVFPRAPFSNLFTVTMTQYHEAWNAPVAFPPETVEYPLGRVLAEAGKNQLRIAETYKYAHVTSFFNGFRESPFPQEYRVLIPSRATPKPEEHPELEAAAVTDRLIASIRDQAFDFILVNYSNPDTIGHTGNYQAAIESVRVIDREIGRVADATLSSNTVLLITSDHGNIEEVISPITALVETQHDPNPVPFYLISPEFKNKQFLNTGHITRETLGILSDVAPTILELMHIPKPETMTGHSLLRGLIN